MATVLCLKGRNPTADPFRMDRFRLYLTRHLKIFLIYAPNLKFIFYYLLSYGCYRHTDTFFFHYLGVLTQQLNGHQHVNTTTPKAQTNKRPERVVKQIETK